MKTDDKGKVCSTYDIPCSRETKGTFRDDHTQGHSSDLPSSLDGPWVELH